MFVCANHQRRKIITSCPSSTKLRRCPKFPSEAINWWAAARAGLGWAGAGLQLGARVTMYQGPDLVKVTLAVAVLGAGLQQTTIPHSGTKHYYIPTVHCPLSSASLVTIT